MSHYITIITSLPYLAPLSANKALPISRIGLEQRLAALSEADRQQLAVMESLFSLSFEALKTNQQWADFWRQQCQSIESDVLKDFFQRMGEALALLSVVRERLLGYQPLTLVYGRYQPQVTKRSGDVLFGLEAQWPEVAAVAQALAEKKAKKASRLFDQWLWNQLILCEQSEMFRYENIVSYVLRWRLVERAKVSRLGVMKGDESKSSLFLSMRDSVINRANSSLTPFTQEAL